MLTPDEQLRLLRKIWGGDHEEGTYVFLPWIKGACRSYEERRDNFHEGRAFEWPSEASAILQHLKTHENDDLYFTPCLFVDKIRRSRYAAPERTLWADLDEADPRRFDQEYRPTLAWETSPGRYQAVWRLSQDLMGASEAGNENHRLTRYLNADPSGYDTTQLLRVPGRPNHKPEKRNEAGEAPEGKVLWSDGPMYAPDDFADLPAVPMAELSQGEDLLDDELLAGIDRHAVWARVRLKVSSGVRELMAIRHVNASDADRSESLWRIERDLADAGCSLAEIVAVVRGSVWNKYKGRADELKRLKIEAAKALNESSTTPTSLEGVAQAKPSPMRFSTLFLAPHPRPRWLVRNIWSVGGCGFISGAPKTYKSWTAMDLAISVATGRSFLGQFPVSEPGPVLYIQEEDSESTVLRRFEQVLDGRAPDAHPYGMVNQRSAGGDRLLASMVEWSPPSQALPLDVSVRRGLRLDDPAWQVWLDEMLTEGQYRLLIVDTLGTTAGDIDTDRANEVLSKVLSPLKQLAGKHQVAICVVHHNRKAEAGSRAGSQMLGSVALHAWVDDALYLRSKEPWRDGVRVNVERESKGALDLKFRAYIPRMASSETDEAGEGDWRWRPAISTWEDDEQESINGNRESSRGSGGVQGGNNGARVRARKGDAITRVLTSMGGKDKPIDVAQIVEVMGQTVSQVKRSLRGAEESGLIEEVNGCWQVTRA